MYQAGFMKLVNPSRGDPWTLGKDIHQIWDFKYSLMSVALSSPHTSHSLAANHPASCGTTTHQKFPQASLHLSPTTPPPASSKNAKKSSSPTGNRTPVLIKLVLLLINVQLSGLPPALVKTSVLTSGNHDH